MRHRRFAVSKQSRQTFDTISGYMFGKTDVLMCLRKPYMYANVCVRECERESEGEREGEREIAM